MDSQLYAALIALGITVVGALGTLVTLLIERVKRDLAVNTKISQAAKDAADGQLQKIINQLAAERNRTLALRELVRERDDRLAYLTSHMPEAGRVLTGYEERRQERHTESQEMAALRRVLEEPPAH
jgi:hypothetical protein